MTQSPSTDDPPLANIDLSFDYEQRSQQLMFSAKAGRDDIYLREGPGAGRLHLKCNQEVDISVTGIWASEPRRKIWNFKVADCFVITVPFSSYQTRAEQKSWMPSPFLPAGATVRADSTPGRSVRDVGNFQESHVINGVTSRYESKTCFSPRALRVISSLPADADPTKGSANDDIIGSWGLTILLKIDFQNPDDLTNTFSRIFRLDPETEVGNGLNAPGNS